MPDVSLFEAIGGMAAVLRLAHTWQERVLADEVVAYAFRGPVHLQPAERLAAYWSEAWGGPRTYSQQYGTEWSVERMHSGNRSHDDMNQRAIVCFSQALDDIGVVDPALRAALESYFTWATETAMDAYPNGKNNVPDGLRMAHWSWNGRQL
jgi:hemoglobin